MRNFTSTLHRACDGGDAHYSSEGKRKGGHCRKDYTPLMFPLPQAPISLQGGQWELGVNSECMESRMRGSQRHRSHRRCPQSSAQLSMVDPGAGQILHHGRQCFPIPGQVVWSTDAPQVFHNRARHPKSCSQSIYCHGWERSCLAGLVAWKAASFCRFSASYCVQPPCQTRRELDCEKMSVGIMASGSAEAHDEMKGIFDH